MRNRDSRRLEHPVVAVGDNTEDTSVSPVLQKENEMSGRISTVDGNESDLLAQKIGNIENSVAKVLHFLSNAREPRTAGSIKFQTGLSEEEWPRIEQQLLNRNLVKKSGSKRRPRFELISH